MKVLFDALRKRWRFAKPSASDTSPPDWQKQIAQVQARYHYVFDNVNDAIFIHDLAGKFLDVNQVACQRLGYSRAELLQMGVMQLDTPDRAAHFAEAMQAFIRAGSVVAESCHVRKDGTIIPVEISARLIEHDGQPAVLSVARDISDRKRMQAELQARHNELETLYAQAEQRARRIAATNEIIRAMSSEHTLDDILAIFAQQTRQLVPFDTAAVILVDPVTQHANMHVVAGDAQPIQRWVNTLTDTPSAPRVALAQRAPIICDNVRAETRFPEVPLLIELGVGSFVICPLIWKDETLGTLNLGSYEPSVYTQATVVLLEPIAAQLATALKTVHLQEQIASMAIRAERDRLGRELHDGLGQVLGYMSLKTTLADEMLERNQVAPAQDVLRELQRVAQEAYSDVREQILGLRTTVAAEQALPAILREYLQRYQREWHITAELTLGDDVLMRLTPPVEIQLLRIIQEALTNVRRHAQAHRVTIHVAQVGPQCAVTIRDDGVGFDPHQPRREHFGLAAMRERAESVGGQFEIESALDQGTQIRVHVPLHSARRGEG